MFKQLLRGKPSIGGVLDDPADSSPFRLRTLVPLAGALQVVVAASAVAGALSGCEPTGSAVVDVLLSAAFAGVVTWAGARAPGRLLVVAAGAAAVAASSAQVGVVLVAWIALVIAIANEVRPLGGIQAQTVVRAVVAGGIVQACLRLAWSPFFTASALVSACVCVPLAVAGLRARPSATRTSALKVALAALVLAILAGIGVAAAGLHARRSATDGYRQLLAGLDLVQAGELEKASVVLRDAAGELDDAVSRLDAPWAQPSRLLPGIAQNRNAGIELMGAAAEAAHSAADVLEKVDLGALRVVDGVIDVNAIARIAEPLRQLDATVDGLRGDLDAADSEWLVAPLRSRLRSARSRAGVVARQAGAATSVATFAPAMLGRDEERRYLLAFSTRAESRGSNGLLGNWSELTISDGALRITASGRIADLQALTALHSKPISATSEFFDRYGYVGAGAPDTGVRDYFWQNVTMSPDFPSVGNALVQMYEDVTGTAVDGLFVIDPAGVAALLDVTGPVSVDGLAQPLDGTNVEQFLLLDQYASEQTDREDLLNAVTEATVAHVLASTLPPPQVLARSMAPAALSGHLSAYAVRPEEQAMIQLIGMDARLPRLQGESYGADGLAVVTDNAGGNKIDTFLQRDIAYLATYEPATGAVTAEVDIHMDNSAPKEGYPPYVISNQVGIRDGTNRMILSVFTPLGLEGVTVNGARAGVTAEHELGYNVYSLVVDIPSKTSVNVHFDLKGIVGSGEYRLVYRPQPLPNSDQLKITATTVDGEQMLQFQGTLARRTVLTAGGVTAWR